MCGKRRQQGREIMSLPHVINEGGGGARVTVGSNYIMLLHSVIHPDVKRDKYILCLSQIPIYYFVAFLIAMFFAAIASFEAATSLI